MPERRDTWFMSQASLDLVRSIYAAWERGDFFSAADWADREIEFVAVGGSEAGSWTGLTELAKTARDRLSVWEDARVKAEQYRELDGGRVLVFFSQQGRGKTSGLDLAQVPTRAAALFHVRAGKVTRLVVYWDRERALADLGLAPEAGSQR
jgi:ketosteroid isomerase-like protein